VLPARLADRTGLDSSTPRDQVEDENDDSYHQQNVNKAAANMHGEAQQPEDEKNDDDCPKHGSDLLTVCLAMASAEAAPRGVASLW
jgi:hypothetical protein